MIITGHKVDVLWDLDGSGNYTAIGRGTRCSVAFDFTFNDVLDMSQGEDDAEFFEEKLLTKAAWTADCDLLCSEDELVALIGAAMGQARGKAHPIVRINMPFFRLTGQAVVASLDIDADLADAVQVAISFEGSGQPEMEEKTEGNGGVFDVTFDSTFQ